MVCSKKRKIGIFFISIVILLIACNHFGKQDNEKSSQFSNSSIDSVRNLVELGDTLNNNNKISFSNGSSSITEELIGVWKIKKYEPLADVFGYTEIDFLKEKGTIAFIITKDSIKMNRSRYDACSYDSITAQEFFVSDFIEHLGYNGYNKEMLKKVKRVKVLSFIGCLNEVYLIDDKFYFEQDGVIIEIQKD
ncbi:MAG: hypothetical protein ACK5RQ_10500 [Bacteroidota bacterium]